MRKFNLLAALSIGAVMATTFSAPSHAETFGPKPTILKDAEVYAPGNGRGISATLGSKTYFAASTAASGVELWVTDGTPAGTKMLKDIDPGPTGSKPEWFTVLNGKVYFAATSAVGGREVWRTDGTSAGTIEVLNVNPGNAPSNPTEMLTSGGKLYFIATHPDFGREVWVSDGTNGPGTQVLESIFGTTGSAPANLSTVVGGVAFSAGNLLGEHRPFFSAGTAATTRYMDGGASPVVTEPDGFTSLGSRIVFRAYRAGTPTPQRPSFVGLWANRATPSRCCASGAKARSPCSRGRNSKPCSASPTIRTTSTFPTNHSICRTCPISYTACEQKRRGPHEHLRDRHRPRQYR